MKKTLALIVSTLTLIGMATIASAQADGTYTFEAGAGQSTAYNGSTITVTGDVVTSFDLTEVGYYTVVPSDGNIWISNPENWMIIGDSGIPWFIGDVASQADGGYMGDIDGLGNALGNWTTGPAVSAPDAASTMELLGAAMIGLGACRRFLRR